MNKPEEWETRWRLFLLDQRFQPLTSDCITLSQSRLEEFIQSELAQAKRLGAEEMIEELEKWLYHNGITHKKSFVALKARLSQFNKDGNP